jgi:hypothetical protein
LFGREERGDFSLESNFWEEVDKVTLEENMALDAPFTESEVKEAVFSCYAEGAAGPEMVSPSCFIRNFGIL